MICLSTDRLYIGHHCFCSQIQKDLKVIFVYVSSSIRSEMLDSPNDGNLVA